MAGVFYREGVPDASFRGRASTGKYIFTILYYLLLRKWVDYARRWFFSAPRLTGPRRHALPVLIPGFFRHRSSSPRRHGGVRPCLPVFVVALAVAASACVCANLLKLPAANCLELRSSGKCLFLSLAKRSLLDSMGCRGLGKGRSLRLYPNPARLWSGPMHFLGTHLGLRPRPAGRCALFEAEGRVCAIERTWP